MSRLIIPILIIISFLLFAPMFSFWYTGLDTFSLIFTGLESTLFDVVSRPLMFSTDFVNDGLYFRPVVAFVFWLLSPFGSPVPFYVVNWLAFAGCVVLIYLIGLRDGRRVGLVAAIFFMCHPLLVENVPVVSRGQDLLCAFFVLAAVYAFPRWYYSGLFLLALGSKEFGIVLLPLLVSILIQRRVRAGIFSPKALIINYVYPLRLGFLAFVVYLLWRFWVIGGVGGYDFGFRSFREVAMAVFYALPVFVFFPTLSYDVLLLGLVLLAASLVVVWFLRGSWPWLLAVVVLGFIFVVSRALYPWYFVLPVALLAVPFGRLSVCRRGVIVVLVVLLGFGFFRPSLALWRDVGEMNKRILSLVSGSSCSDFYDVPIAIRLSGVRGGSFMVHHAVGAFVGRSVMFRTEDYFKRWFDVDLVGCRFVSSVSPFRSREYYIFRKDLQ